MQPMPRSRALILLALIACCSCSSVADVAAVDSAAYRCQLSRNGGCPTHVPGVPFYTKTAKCVQETTYVTSVVTLNFTRPKAADPVSKVFVGPSVETQQKIADFVKLVDGKEDPDDKLIAGWNEEWNKLVSTTPTGVLLANTLTQEMRVDDSVTYFLNGVHPWAGTGSIKFDLAPDQTLTKVDANVTDDTIKQLTAAIPVVASALGAAGVAAKALPSAKARAEAKQELKLLVLRQRDACSGTTTPPAIPLSNVSMVESELRQPGKSGGDEGGTKATKITFKGEVEKKNGE